MFIFVLFFSLIFSISFVSGIIAFFHDIKNFNTDKKKIKIVSSANGGDEDGDIGTDTGSDTTDIAELE